MSSGRASNLNSPSSSLPVTANTLATTVATAAAGKPSEPIAASHLKHNILAWDTTPLHTGAADTGRPALPTLGTSPTNLRGTLLREGIFPTEPNSAAIAPTSANVSNTSLSNTNNTNVEASSGGSYGYSSRLTSSAAAAQHRRASHMTLVRQPHPTSSAVHGANAGLNSPFTLPATANINTVTTTTTTATTATNTNADTPAATTATAVEDELAATGLSFEVEHPSSSHTEDKSHTTHNSNEDDIDGCCTAEAKRPHNTKTKAEAATTAAGEGNEEDNSSAAPQPSPQPVPIARHSPPAEAAAPQTTNANTNTTTNTNTTPAAPTPTIVSANTTHPYCNYFKPPIEPGRQRWLLSFNASSPSNNSIANGGGALLGNSAAGGGGGVNGANMNNAMRGLDANGECGGAAWRQSSDTLQGWAEMCTGGCTLRKNATGSHLLFITEEYTVAEEPLMAMSCANCVLLRAAVCLPRGKSEACFSAQAQYRYVMYNAGPPTGTATTTPNARERGTTEAAAPLVYVGLGLTPRLNEELKGGFYLVLAQLNNDGAASVSIGLWRVTERDTIEQQRILHPPQTVRLAHDKLTLRLVIREGEFDVYANDATALHSAVAAPGLKLGESYALLLNTGGPVSVRHIALAEGERPPESRVFQFYTNSPTATPATVPNTTAQGNSSPATQLNSPHKATNVKHSPPPRGRNSPPSLQQQQQAMSSRANTAGSGGRERTSRNNSPPIGANNSSSNSPSQQQQQQQQSQPQSPHSGPYHHSASQQQHSSLNSPNKTTASTGATGRQTRGGNVSGRNSPPSGNATETNVTTSNVPPAPLPPAMTSPYANNTNNTNTNNARPTRRGNYAGQTGTTNSGRPSRPGTGNGRTNAHGNRRNTNATTIEGDDATDGLPPNVDPQLAAAIQAEIMERVPQVAWDDIAGLADGKRLLKEAVLLPLLLPELFVGVVQPWRGVLLFGPPGTGKTMLAKAVATSAKTTFFNISASTLNNKHYGESEKLVRTLFELARHYAPSTIFFDEVDALVSQRSCTEHEASRRVKSEMLQQMDGLHATNTTGGNSEGRVLVLATTNRPWDLDEAIRRRLEKRIYIPLPDEAGRRALLEKHMAHLNLGSDVDVEAIVKATEHFSGADIAVIVRDAAMMPVRRLIDTYTTEEIAAKKAAGELEVTAVNMEDFRSALSRAAPSVSKESLERFATWAATYGST